MIPYKLKYMQIPRNNLKPLDYFFERAIPGERLLFENARQVEDLVRSKYREGWKYLAKDETEEGFVLYFVKDV